MLIYTKEFVDAYANHATMLGLVVSVVGFGLTVWTLKAGIRANKRAQDKIQQEVEKVRQEAMEMIEKIRSKSLQYTCDQAIFLVEEARYAIRTKNWLRAVEKTGDARRLALDLLGFSALVETERTPMRSIVEDLRTTVSFIERNRLKNGSVIGLPDEKVALLVFLSDVLGQIRSRFNQQLMRS